VCSVVVLVAVVIAAVVVVWFYCCVVYRKKKTETWLQHLILKEKLGKSAEHRESQENMQIRVRDWVFCWHFGWIWIFSFNRLGKKTCKKYELKNQKGETWLQNCDFEGTTWEICRTWGKKRKTCRFESWIESSVEFSVGSWSSIFLFLSLLLSLCFPFFWVCFCFFDLLFIFGCFFG